MDPLARKRALDTVQDLRNVLKLQIQSCSAYEDEREVMLQTLDQLWKAAARAGQDGGESVYPDMVSRLKR